MVARLAQVTDCCAPADAVWIIERKRTAPRRVGVVVVGTILIAGGPTGVVEGSVFGIQLLVFETPNADGTGVAVEGIAKVGVGFVFAKVRE